MSHPIPEHETLTVEFKSDRKRLSDRELIETVVCLANTDGGSIYLGVEDDGTPTGLHPEHRQLTGLGAMISNRTVPPVPVVVERMTVHGHEIARIEVPSLAQIVATSDGVYKRRRLQADGRPECVPLLPHEFATRLSALGSADLSAQLVPGSTLDDLDPVERARLRQFIERYGGDRALLALDDQTLDGAMGLTLRQGASRQPTLAGLLLMGTEEALRRHVPTHEIAFQVMEGEAVRLNEFTRAPLLRAFEWIETLFKPLNPEEELQVGLYRVPVPRVDQRAFREAVANAVAHRDYSRLGAIHIRLETDTLVISNPGGLVEGVTLNNLLTTEPRPRNPALADAIKRIGLVERTGRGVGLIYRGLLRYGRSGPDYSRSDRHSVVLRLPTSAADLGFLRLILEEEREQQRPLPIDSLIALSVLKDQRRLGRADLAAAIQKSEAVASQTLEALVESGLVQGHGATKGRTYTLAPQVYAAIGQKAEYMRQAAFAAIQHEHMVRSLVQQNGEVRRQDVVTLCRISKDQASRLLGRMVDEGLLIPHGERRGRYYTPGPKLGGEQE